MSTATKLTAQRSKMRPVSDTELAAATGGTQCVSAFGWSACGYIDDKGFGGGFGNGKDTSYWVDVTIR